MKLIFLYGPPAVGKLTIAKVLSEKTGIKIFHNHLTIDLVSEFFERNKSRGELVHRIRLEVMKEAAKQDVDLIFTFVYESRLDDEMIDEFIHAIEDNGGKIEFINITCSKEELLKRVTNESRGQFTKITSPEYLESILKESKLLDSIGIVKSLVIDNTNLSPEEVADRIINECLSND